MEKINIGRNIPFSFLGEDHQGEVLELYNCSGRQMALIQSDLDNLKYPIDISSRVERVVKKQNKSKLTKKQRVLDMISKLVESEDGYKHIVKTDLIEADFDPTPIISGKFNDTFYVKKVCKESGYEIQKEGDYFKIKTKN